MTTPIRDRPSSWAVTFCCTAPFIALIVFSASALFGMQPSGLGLFSLATLCGGIIARVIPGHKV